LKGHRRLSCLGLVVSVPRKRSEPLGSPLLPDFFVRTGCLRRVPSPPYLSRSDLNFPRAPERFGPEGCAASCGYETFTYYQWGRFPSLSMAQIFLSLFLPSSSGGFFCCLRLRTRARREGPSNSFLERFRAPSGLIILRSSFVLSFLLFTV